MVPSGYKEDTVYSVVPSDGSGDLSFTRASNGTRINSAGLVEVCPWNLAQYSEDFSNSVWSIQGSSISSDSTTAPNGTTTADTLIESNTTDEHNRFQELNIGTGEFTYSIYLKYFNTDYCALYVFNPSLGGVRYWVNVNTLTAGTSANIGSGIGTTSLSLASVGSGWVRASITFTNPSGVCRFYVANAQSNGGATTYAGNGTSGVYIWGAQLNIGSTAKPYFPTTDRLNVPRLTYQNGGGGCPSLLLEKQSTNNVFYSEQFDNAYWVKEYVTISTNATTSPDGTQNAEKIQEDTSNASHVVGNNDVFAGGGQSVTFSIFLKASERSWAALRLYDGSGSKFAWYNLSTGVLGSVDSGVTASIQNYGNGWFRCIMTITMSSVSITLPYVFLATGNNVKDYTGTSGYGLFVWGAQHEASSYATSYIPTTSASATRVADACSKTGISSLIGQTEGTMFMDFVAQVTTTAQSHLWIGVAGNEIGLYGNTQFIFYSSGGVSINGGAFVTGERYKIAFAYKANDYVAYVNGVQKGTDTSATVPTTSAVYVNSYSDFTEIQSKQVNEVVLFPTRLSNSELASLTTI